MLEMFLTWLLLNVPEGALVTNLMFREYGYKENRIDYLIATIFSSAIIFIVPEVITNDMLYMPVLIVMISFMFYNGYKISIKRSIYSSIQLMIITGIAQIPLMYVLNCTIGLNEYFQLDTISKFIIMMPSRFVEFVILKKLLKGEIKMKKVWLLGKSTRRNRGEKA